jgi:hypothetical protein
VWALRSVSRRAGRLVDGEAVGRLWREFADVGALERHPIDMGVKSAVEVADGVARLFAPGA